SHYFRDIIIRIVIYIAKLSGFPYTKTCEVLLTLTQEHRCSVLKRHLRALFHNGGLVRYSTGQVEKRTGAQA
ncbi:hypothetical protein GBAR_LOCUS13919, partial [Geodia barretti]